MSDSGEYKTSEKESKSQEGETTKNSKKRMIDADDDEDPKNQSSKLENLKKVAEKTLPLACSICKEPFLDPIVTKCNHYFCHLCALERHGKNNKCFLCDQQTLGVFNTAVEIKKKIAQVREKAKVMVKEVKTMVENAAVIVKEAEAMSAESAEMVAGVETLVGILETFGPNSVADPSWHSVINLVDNVEDIAENARGKAEKAAEMVKEANAATERRGPRWPRRWW